MTLRCSLLAFTLPVTACTVDLGDECSQLAITEVMSTGESWTLKQWGLAVDWIELRNDTGGPLNVGGFGIDGPGWGFIEGSRFPDHWVLDDGEYLVLMASTYDFGDTGDLRRDPGEFSLFLDLNNDGATVDLIGPGGIRQCQHVGIPDQHAGFSWSFQDTGEEPWCHTEPTPGFANQRCVCDRSISGC